MKIKALFLTLMLTSVLFLLSASGSLFASNCGKELECPPGIKYPYIFCNIDAVNKKVTTETICTDDPLEYQKNNPDFIARKVKLPVIVSGPSTYFTMVTLFSVYKDGDFEVVLFGANALKIGITAGNDLVAAANKWNCVCGDTVIPGITKIGTTIKSEFSSNPSNFPYPYRNPAVAVMVTNGGSASGNYYCNLDLDSAIIRFNMTPEFLYQRNFYPVSGTPLEKGWFSQEFKGNISLVPNYVYLYSFQQVAMHELGHMLGFGHFTKDLGASIGQYCDDNPEELQGVMKYNTVSRENMTELSLHDKCMMAKLYCDSLIVLNIFEYQPTTQKVYPNPGKYVVSFDFELPRYTEDLRMTVKDLLGQTLLIPIENAVYDAGKHTVLINVDSLAIGTYYIIIEAGAYRTAQPVMIVR